MHERRPRRSRRRRVLEGLLDSGGSTAKTNEVRPKYPAWGPVMRVDAEGRKGVRSSAMAGPSTQPYVAGIGQAAGAPGFARSVRIVGRTDANFSFDFETLGGTTRPSTGCPTCGADACLRARGTLVVTMTTNPVVTLPTINPNLTPCQARRVQTAIDTQIAPHEQQHVAAFQTYDAVRRRPFDLKFCDQADFDARIGAIVRSIEGPRRSAAQAASDALDTPPFEINVDIDCTEPTPPPKSGKGSQAPPSNP